MNKKIFLPLFLSSVIFLNAKSIALSSDYTTKSNNIFIIETKMTPFSFNDYKINIDSLNLDSSVKNNDDYNMSGMIWGASIGALLGLFLGILQDNNEQIKIMKFISPIFGAIVFGIGGALFDLGKNSAKK